MIAMHIVTNADGCVEEHSGDEIQIGLYTPQGYVGDIWATYLESGYWVIEFEAPTGPTQRIADGNPGQGIRYYQKIDCGANNGPSGGAK